MIYNVKGDLVLMALQGKFNAIAHGCNCFGVMGGGIAKTIAKVWPDVYKADLLTPIGDIKKMGSYSMSIENDLYIFNIYSQFGFGQEKIQVDYTALNCGIEKVFMYLDKLEIKIQLGLPYIGAGLAGGDWELIKKNIESIYSKYSNNIDLTFVEFVI